MNPTSLSGTSPTRPRKRGGWRGKAALLLFLIGVGFYLGIKTTLRVAEGGPDWLKRPFGVAEWKKAGDPSLLPPALPASPAGKPDLSVPVTPSSAAPPPAAQPQNAVSSPTPSSPAGSPSTAASASSGDLARQVSTYHRELYRIQSVFGDFKTARADSADTSLPAERTQAASDRLTVLTDEMVSGVQKAQALKEELDRNPQTKLKYREGETVIAPALARAAFPEMSVDNLKFLLLN